MVIDTHVSVFPDDPRVLDEKRDIPNLRVDPAECTLDRTLERMDRLGVERSVIWSVGTTAEECRRLNDFTASVVEGHPDRFVGFAVIYPGDGETALTELGRAVDELGLVGVKFHPSRMEIALDDERFLALFRAVARRDLPFVSHVNPTLLRELDATDGQSGADSGHDPISTAPRTAFADASRLRALLEIWDSPRVQSAHMGGVRLAEVLGSRITFQTAGASREVIQWAVERAGAHRVVFGSDIPFFSVEEELAKVRALDVGEDDRAAILRENAATRVLGGR